MRHYLVAALFLFLTISQAAAARDYWLAPVSPSLLDETPWDISSERHGIGDPWLLFAITLEESGRIDAEASALRPWPFTLHRDKREYTFSSKKEAQATIREWEAQGFRNYDIGPLQINRHWHGDHFDDLSSLLDVATAVDYAASIIAHAHRRFGGDLVDAAGRYRSWSNAKKAAEYAERIRIIRIQLPK